jgi:hypothetical protein
MGLDAGAAFCGRRSVRKLVLPKAAGSDTGDTPFDQVLGYSFWEFYRRNAEAAAILNRSDAQSYDWSRFPLIADIGGRVGSLFVEILEVYPSCRGILFEQPKVVQQAIS